MLVKIWGARGSIPTPGRQTITYGGNTTCLEIRTDEHIIILDAGSGIRELGESLTTELRNTPMDISLFITHAHWDHIQGFPFFKPAYMKDRTISIYGTKVSEKGIHDILAGQTQFEYFPIPIKDMASHLEYYDLTDPVQINDIRVDHYYVNHPGNAVGYKITEGDSVFIFTGDVESYTRSQIIFNKNDKGTSLEKLEQRFIDFCSNADLMVADACYTEEEYANRRGWGHNTNIDTANLALNAQVGKVILTHHDPQHTDSVVDQVLVETQEYIHQNNAAIECLAAWEGLELSV